jgi:hypothetical protein
MDETHPHLAKPEFNLTMDNSSVIPTLGFKTFIRKERILSRS